MIFINTDEIDVATLTFDGDLYCYECWADGEPYDTHPMDKTLYAGEYVTRPARCDECHQFIEFLTGNDEPSYRKRSP